MSTSTSQQTIMVYFAGVHLFHIENEFPDPTKGAPLLHYLCAAIRHSDTHKARKRHPITLSLLRTIKAELSQSSLPSRDKLMYWAAFVLAFYGFLRASEYMVPMASCFDPWVHLSVRDITVCPESVMLHLKRSKMDRFGKSATLLIGQTGTSTCPVRAMQKFMAIRQYENPGPLLTMKSGKFLTCQDVSETTQHLLQSAGLDSGSYSSHSYRIGTATAAAAAGLPDHLIKTLGYWHSTAYQRYICTSPAILRGVASHIARMH